MHGVGAGALARDHKERPNVPGDDNRPCAPDYLLDNEAEEWDRIVQSMPQDWFRPEAEPVLASLCREIVTVKAISRRINRINVDRADEKSLRMHSTLVRQRLRLNAAIASLSGKLRLTPRSRYSAKKAHVKIKNQGPAAAPKPWDR